MIPCLATMHINRRQGNTQSNTLKIFGCHLCGMSLGFLYDDPENPPIDAEMATAMHRKLPK